LASGSPWHWQALLLQLGFVGVVVLWLAAEGHSIPAGKDGKAWKLDTKLKLSTQTRNNSYEKERVMA
jgi:hypothetical protein